MLISLLFTEPITFFLLAIALVISLTIHEFAHAFVSNKLGDPTAKSLGRLTLNPSAHLDPWGTIALLVAGIGWGKPVPYNPMYFKNPKRDTAFVSLAGPISNFVLAFISAMLLKLMIYNFMGYSNAILINLLSLLVFYNLILGFFNLIPIHPLDGFKVVGGILPQRLSYQWAQVASYGSWILLALVFTRSIGKILNPLVSLGLRILGLSSFF